MERLELDLADSYKDHVHHHLPFPLFTHPSPVVKSPLECSITKMSVCDEKTKYVFDDDKRPALPYVAGACFSIKRHKRLTPFDRGICYEFPEVFSLSDPVLPSEILRPSEILKPKHNWTPWSRSSSKRTDPGNDPPGTITERYLRHRPRKTKPYKKDMTTRRLEIVRQIRARDGAYAQVVQCRVDGIRGPLVAKIFDPLYRWEDVDLDMVFSPVGLSESDWSREAAAYARIRERGLDGRYTPRFEGCWSFDIPYELELELASNSATDDITAPTTTTSGRQSERGEEKRRGGLSEELTRRTIKVTRNVRLLLMEHIPGDSILHLLETGAYRNIPPDVRMDLLARIGEAQSALWHIRVSHGDPHARNVVVGAKQEDHHPSSSSSPPPGKGRRGGPRWARTARTTRTRRPGVACHARRFWQLRRIGFAQRQKQPQRPASSRAAAEPDDQMPRLVASLRPPPGA